MDTSSGCTVLYPAQSKAMSPINSMNSGHQTNPKGFTLLEILIATFLFGVVLTIIYTSYTGTMRVVDTAESQAEIYRMARIALERILEDLESVYVSQMKEGSESEKNAFQPFQFVGEDKEISGRDADTLSFASTAHINLSGKGQEPGAAEIGYYVQENNEGEDFILLRSDRPVFEGAVTLEEQINSGFVLCEKLVSVSFSYHGEDGEIFESWDSSSGQQKGKIPKMVSIALKFVNSANPESPLVFMTRVALVMKQG